MRKCMNEVDADLPFGLDVEASLILAGQDTGGA